MVIHNYTKAEVDAASNSPWAKNTSIGTALTDALDTFITDGRMEPQVALKVLATFDRVVAEVLAEKVKARLSFKGHLDTYRFCDEVWTFIIKDITFKLENSTNLHSDKIKIVAMNAKKPGET
ncbi:uncharacterized protein PV09_07961 [Verruconis gallopava]|uniref:Transcription initiation factor IIA subunit 2 n=1 Tax=Verruconis gallopava TaxID=253628 RepID=A0A0D1XE25_9PEZI|nr:uncharacterized protein PV09_07961 [Verruconis gallopava]KIW00431.1 hypothetical protein PV09_07961 [Verruconis gallopava]